MLYDDIGGRGGGRKPAAGGHRKVAHAIATQRIKTGRINLTANETTRRTPAARLFPRRAQEREGEKFGGCE